MEKTGRVLCLDFDDVIMKSKGVMESIIKTIDYRASEEYLHSVIQKAELDDIDEETEGELIRCHFDLKDRILEEVDEKFKNLIDYNKVINLDNIYPNSIEYINYLCNCGYYDKVYIVSHCNVSSEISVKQKFIDKYLPNVTFIPVPFHKDAYGTVPKRKRTSKALYLKEYLKKQNILNYTLIDDSLGNCVDWQAKGGIYIRFNSDNKNIQTKEIASLQPFDIFALNNYPRLESSEKSRRK